MSHPGALTDQSSPMFEADLPPGPIPHDGLSDDQGPIPAFGLVPIDAHGQITMSQEEWDARRAASIRAMSALGEITDESDRDEIWDEVFRGLEEAC